MTKEEYAQMLEAMRKRTVAEPQNADVTFKNAKRSRAKFVL